MSINVYTFSGNIGRDAEVGATKGGTSVCRFSVAVSSGFGDKEVTTWVECSIFGKRAEGKLPQYLKKGSVVVVSGEPTLDKWVGKDGTERTSLKVLVNSVDPLFKANDRGGDANNGGNNQPAQKSNSAPQSDFEDSDIPFS